MDQLYLVAMHDDIENRSIIADLPVVSDSDKLQAKFHSVRLLCSRFFEFLLEHLLEFVLTFLFLACI